jgi:hypothetical protein
MEIYMASSKYSKVRDGVRDRARDRLRDRVKDRDRDRLNGILKIWTKPTQQILPLLFICHNPLISESVIAP